MSGAVGAAVAHPLVGAGVGVGVWLLEKALEHWESERDIRYDVVAVQWTDDE